MRAASVCALLLALSACSRTAGRLRPQLQPPLPAAVLEVFQTGVASWYGGDFHGRTTANGEVYDMHKLTAAHQNLPFHTLVEVENLENGRKALVRINDRGPFLKERIIDLSLKAAQRLGMEEKGTASVALRVVRWGGAAASEGVLPSAPTGAAAPCHVQVGAYSLRDNAEGMRLTLLEIFPGIPFRVAQEDGLFKVISSELTAAACREVLQRLATHRLEGFIRESGFPGEE